MADALMFLLKNYSGDAPLNVGSGVEVTIRALAENIAEVVGSEADLLFDSSKPDGTPRMLVDSAKLNAHGWNSARSLKEGLAQTYASVGGNFS